MASFLEKVRHLRQAYKQHGGLVASYLQLYRTDELKWGELIGTDVFGNKYYQNKQYIIGRSRWVEYAPQFGHDIDGSQIPAEWHRWMHYMGDENPVSHPPPERKWMITHRENYSGTDKAYYPYSTTRPKIQAWKPPTQSS